MKKLFMSIALTLCAISNPVQAEPGYEQRLVQVADLDLSTTAGRATLDERLSKAVRRVCRMGTTRSIRAAAQARKCMAEAKARVAPMRDAAIANAAKTKLPDALAQVNN